MPTEEPIYRSSDYIELLIRHLARSKKVSQAAAAYRLTGEDFITSEDYGVQLYSILVDSVLEATECPVAPDLLALLFKNKMDNKDLTPDQREQAIELFEFIYQGELNPDYFTGTLKNFLEYRRLAKAQIEHSSDIEAFAERVREVGIELSSSIGLEGAVSVNPFETPLILPATRGMILTGFPSLDAITRGLSPGEYGQIIGYSGGGKTAMGSNIALYNGSSGVPAMYISMEADEFEMSNRFYSNFFDIEYRNLREGGSVVAALLNQKFREEQYREKRELLRSNLCIEGLKGLSPLNCNQLQQRIVQKYETTGFIPRVIVIDQLQFLEPNQPKKNEPGWEAEQRVAADVDELSHMELQGVKPVVWALHQAKGKLKRVFSREEIHGFKGVVHKPDICLGIGRENEQSADFSIFSLKVRHCAPFVLNYIGDLAYMRFLEVSNEALALPEDTNARVRHGGRHAPA